MRRRASALGVGCVYRACAGWVVGAGPEVGAPASGSGRGLMGGGVRSDEEEYAACRARSCAGRRGGRVYQCLSGGGACRVDSVVGSSLIGD